jgi:hypothetical protein
MMLFRILDDDLRQKIDALTLSEANGAFVGYDVSYYLAKADLNPGGAHGGERKVFYGKAVSSLGMALAYMKLMSITPEPWMYAQFAVAQAGVGNRKEALAAIEEGAALAGKNKDAINEMIIEDFRVQMSMLLEDRAATLRLIEAALKRPSNYTAAWFKKDPLFAPLRADPEFIRLTGP